MFSPVILTRHHTGLQKDVKPGKSPAKTSPTTQMPPSLLQPHLSHLDSLD